MTDTDVPAGLVAGKYRLTRKVGRGGMGTVWEGIHDSLGTRVAVKFIDSEYAESADVRQRFVNEARAAARLKSKHVVQVYDQGVGDDGRPYIVMEFLAGEPLDRRLDRQGRLEPLETARIVMHVCRALAKAHESGIVHRDLKPENIFLVHDEEDQTDIVKVVDFGIAKVTDASATGSSSTRTGAVLGTPQFMSPEQARGLRTVDHRTDLWSLGVIAYRCLVGSLPFRGEAVGDLLVNICTSPAPVPSHVAPDVLEGFDAWIARALARDPGDRFQTAAELGDSLAALTGLSLRMAAGPASKPLDAPSDGAISPGAVTAAPLSTTHSPARKSNRSRWVFGAVGFAVVAIAAFATTRAVRHVNPEPSAAGSVQAAAASATAAPSAAEPEITPVVPSATPPAPSAEPAAESRPRPGNRPKLGGEPEPKKAAHGAKSSRPANLLGY